MKPFLDAFYGPYTSRYRYWTGILLLARIFIFITFAFYTPNNACYKPMSMVILTTTLLTFWIALSQDLSIYDKTALNYLELFFHFNLALFSILSTYLGSTDKKTQYQANSWSCNGRGCLHCILWLNNLSSMPSHVQISSSS